MFLPRFRILSKFLRQKFAHISQARFYYSTDLRRRLDRTHFVLEINREENHALWVCLIVREGATLDVPSRRTYVGLKKMYSQNISWYTPLSCRVISRNIHLQLNGSNFKRKLPGARWLSWHVFILIGMPFACQHECKGKYKVLVFKLAILLKLFGHIIGMVSCYCRNLPHLIAFVSNGLTIYRKLDCSGKEFLS